MEAGHQCPGLAAHVCGFVRVCAGVCACACGSIHQDDAQSKPVPLRRPLLRLFAISSIADDKKAIVILSQLTRDHVCVSVCLRLCVFTRSGARPGSVRRLPELQSDDHYGNWIKQRLTHLTQEGCPMWIARPTISGVKAPDYINTTI